jgi:hypothetical protein
MNNATIARTLGYAGLIPFVALALGCAVPSLGGALFWLGDVSVQKAALRTYGAIIVSFMSALHWAYGLVAPWRTPQTAAKVLAWSVFPALVAWFATWAMPPRLSFIVLATCLVGVLYVDHCLKSEPWFPPWYWPLRVQLTAVSSLSLVLVAIVS